MDHSVYILYITVYPRKQGRSLTIIGLYIYLGIEEKKLAIEDGNLNSDGVPMITVVADGSWCKRSYKTKYDSLSGVVRYYKFF